MRFQSPLSNLCDVLIQIQDSANLYESTLTSNEAATRAVLVDPVLRALGWDTANTNMVEVEKTLDQVRADYALYDNNSIPRIIVEAKSLGTDLNQKKLVMSLVNYAFGFGLKDVFLTDGLVWHHFDDFQPGYLEPRKVIDLVKNNPVECAAYLVQHLDAAKFWPVEQTIDVLSQRIEELESSVSTMQQNLSSLLITKTAQPAIDQPVSLLNIFDKVVGDSEDLVFIDLDDVDDIAGKKPSHLRLPDGSILKIKSWKDILRESCKFTLAQNPSIPIPFADRVGKKVLLFNYVKPAKGISYVTEEFNGKTLYIYVNYDSYNCVANSIYVLKQVPKAVFQFPPAIVVE
jgi:predicted type IV restriction endonuclease